MAGISHSMSHTVLFPKPRGDTPSGGIVRESAVRIMTASHILSYLSRFRAVCVKAGQAVGPRCLHLGLWLGLSICRRRHLSKGQSRTIMSKSKPAKTRRGKAKQHKTAQHSLGQESMQSCSTLDNQARLYGVQSPCCGPRALTPHALAVRAAFTWTWPPCLCTSTSTLWHWQLDRVGQAIGLRGTSN